MKTFKLKARAICFVLILSAAWAVAEEATDRWAFKTPGAKLAVRHHEAQLDRAAAEFNRQATKSRESLIKELDSYQEQAVRARDLDEAVLLRGAVEKLKKEQPRTHPNFFGIRTEVQPDRPGGILPRQC